MLPFKITSCKTPANSNSFVSYFLLRYATADKSYYSISYFVRFTFSYFVRFIFRISYHFVLFVFPPSLRFGGQVVLIRLHAKEYFQKPQNHAWLFFRQCRENGSERARVLRSG